MSEYLENQLVKAKIEKFFGLDFVNAESSCPICGASVSWDWLHTKNIVLHIEWHERMLFWES